MIDSGVPRRIRRKVLANPIEHDDGVVEGIPDDREDGGEHRQVEVEPEHRKDAESDHHVVEQGHNGAGGELPLEPEHHVQEDGAQRDEHREAALLGQLLADLRAHELDPAQIDLRIPGTECVERTVAQLRPIHVVSRGDSDDHVVRGPEMLDDGALETRSVQRGAYRLQLDGTRIAHLDQRAAGEIDSELEAPDCERHDRDDQQRRRELHRETATAHEVEVESLPDEFHGSMDRSLRRDVLPEVRLRALPLACRRTSG